MVVIVLCVALACIWATLSAPIAWRISRPLRRVSTILDELSNLDFTRSVEAPRSGFVEVAAIQSSCSQLRTGLRAFVKLEYLCYSAHLILDMCRRLCVRTYLMASLALHLE